VARWGAQLDLREIRQAGPGELSAEAVAGYIAKYATKATESYGAALDRRINHEHELDHTCGCRPTSPCWRGPAGSWGASRP
jgi:hypothetical protein